MNADREVASRCTKVLRGGWERTDGAGDVVRLGRSVLDAGFGGDGTEA
jgi:hypothetical protein